MTLRYTRLSLKFSFGLIFKTWLNATVSPVTDYRNNSEMKSSQVTGTFIETLERTTHYLSPVGGGGGGKER